MNGAGALEAARLAGADAAGAIEGLAGFHGAGRRFERLGQTEAGAVVYDDYAHHPTEVAATLRAARTFSTGGWWPCSNRIFTRAPRCWPASSASLWRWPTSIVVLDVYPARERGEDHLGVSGLLIAEAAADAAGGRPVYWLPTFAQAEPILREMLGESDVCLVMGAGNVDALGRALVEANRV